MRRRPSGQDPIEGIRYMKCLGPGSTFDICEEEYLKLPPDQCSTRLHDLLQACYEYLHRNKLVMVSRNGVL